jgi:hypothetical protein
MGELLLPGDRGAERTEPLDIAIEVVERPGGAAEVDAILHDLVWRVAPVDSVVVLDWARPTT